MKKTILLALAFAFAAAGLCAQEGGFTFRPLFSGGGPSASLYGFGGKGEAAFLFYDSGLQASWHLVGRGGSVNAGGERYGVGSFGAKLSLGGLWTGGSFRSYAFVEGGLGMAGGNFGAHMAGLFGGGGGLDWLFAENASLYVELGYMQHHINGKLVGGPSVSIGARSFFR